MTNALVTQQLVEVVYTDSAISDLNVTAQNVEVIYTDTAVSNLQATQQLVEVIYTRKPWLEATQQLIEVLYTPVTAVSNDVDVIPGTISRQGIMSTVSSSPGVYSNLKLGSINRVGAIQNTVIANISASIAYEPTIQCTVDTYYLTPATAGYLIDYYPYKEFYVTTCGINVNKTTATSVATQTFPIQIGHIDTSFLRDFYYRVYIDIINLDLGNVLSQQVFHVEIWNAWFNSDNLASVLVTDLADVTLTLPFTIPHDFGPLENQIIAISANATGINNIDGSYTFVFEETNLILYVTGQRIKLWPFAPSWTFTETREYLTDIIFARAKEERTSLRDIPRTSINHTYTLREREEFALAKSLANEICNLAIASPLWTDYYYLGEVTLGTSILYFNTQYYEFSVDSNIILWTNYKHYEILVIKELYADRIVVKTPTAVVHTKCFILPVILGYTGGIQIFEGEHHKHTSTLTLVSVNTYIDPIWPNDVTFKSLPVTLVPLIASEDIESTYNRVQEAVDSIFGNMIKFDVENYNRLARVATFATDSRADLFNLRRQFDYLMGKYNTFWLPSFHEDIIVLNDIVAGIDTVQIIGEAWDTLTPQYVRIIGDIDSTSQGDTINMFTVFGIVPNGDGTSYIRFVEMPTVNITNIKQIEIMKKVRLDTDSIAYAHKSAHNGEFVTMVKAMTMEVNDE